MICWVVLFWIWFFFRGGRGEIRLILKKNFVFEVLIFML